MRASKSLRQAINQARSRYMKRLGLKKNGVLPRYWFDFGSRGPHTDKKAKEPRYKYPTHLLPFI